MWVKNCGHDDCAVTGGEGCCLCFDSLGQLPYLQAYECYLKGIGFTESDLRERYQGICVECRKRIKSHHPPWEKETPPSSSASKPFTEKNRGHLGKECGHGYCTLVTQEGCCACLDKRPFSKSYERYVDRKGFVMVSDLRERYRGYCPECKNALMGQPIPWDEENSMVGERNRYAQGRNKNSTRKERPATNRELMRKQKAKSGSEGAAHALSHYNQTYRDEANYNMTKLAKLFGLSGSRVESTAPAFSNEKTSFVPAAASSSDFEAQSPSSTSRHENKFRFPSFSWLPFHHKHKEPEPSIPGPSTSVAEPPPFESDLPDSAPPPYTPYASDGTRFQLPPRDEKARGRE